MGFLDKAKDAAQQAKQKSQQLAQQGQAKVHNMQQERSANELYRTLGEAYYAEQRREGDHEAVVAALTALDEHFAAAPEASDTPEQSAPAPSPTPDQPAAPASPSPETSSGNFTLDNF